MQVTFNTIVELNHLLKENDLDFKIHLSDACGGTSMWIESLLPEVVFKSNTRLYAVINQYFAEHNMQLQYSEDRASFWTI